MSVNRHQLTIYLSDGSKETYTLNSDEEIDMVRSSLLREISNEGVLTLMTEDKRLLFYPLNSIMKISVSNVEGWQECHTCFISVTTGV